MTSSCDPARAAGLLAPGRWAHIRTIVEETAALPGEGRSSFLDVRCGNDGKLRERVESLVQSVDRCASGWGFLARSAIEIAAPLLALAPTPPDRGDTVPVILADRYRIMREIGAGGTATVYLATDLLYGRQVAIKMLHPERLGILRAERFLAEIRMTAGLQHPHILPLLDSGTANGVPFFVTPLIDGGTLRQRLVRKRRLAVAEVVRTACALAEALDYAHRRGIIHRDIKPENILLREGQPVVGDFGIALAVHSEADDWINQPGVSVGTPRYMSPEQTCSEQQLTVRSDVYALGVVTYEMLTGAAPFAGATVAEVITRIRTELPTRVRVLRPNVPASVEAAVLIALKKSPADRFESAAEFAHALTVRSFSVTRA